MKINFRKIGSVLASAVMVSSTVALAAAANYPAPFVQNGSSDVAIVYGSNPAATLDLVAAQQIQTSLKSSVASVPVSGNTNITGGDYVTLERTSTKFHIGNGIKDVVSGTITSDDLKTLLADGTFLDSDNNEFDYTQKINLANSTVSMFEDNDYKADVPTIGMKIASGADVLNYTLDFTSQPAWDKLETADITLLGKKYYILDADTPTNSTLTLLDSAQSTTLDEGASSKITVGDKVYDVTVSWVGETKVKLNINGVETNSLAEGQTYKLTDGSYVGIRDLLYSSKSSGVSKVEFSIGSGKLKLVHGQDIELNEDSVSRLKTFFTTTSGKLTKIVLEWKADNDLFVAADQNAVLPGFGSVKLSYGGFSYPTTEKVTVEAGSDSYLVLKDFPLKSGATDIEFLYGSANNFSGLGKDADKRLVTSAGSTLTFDQDTDQNFVVSWTDGKDAESYLVKATGFKSENSGATNKTTFQYKAGSSWTDAKTDAKETDTVRLGNAELTVGAVSYDGKNVLVTAGSNVNFTTLYSKEGLKVWLPFSASSTSGVPGAIFFANSTTNSSSGYGVAGHNNATFALSFAEEDKNGNIASGTQFNLTLGWNSATTPQATVSDVVGESVAFEEQSSSDKFESHIYSALATGILWDKTGDQYSVDLSYHGSESAASVLVSAPSVSVGSNELGNVIVKDSEASSDKNLIVVGGSCVNTVAASLLGSTTAICGTDFTAKTGVNAGGYLVQTFARTNGKIATLVAGYNAADTQIAAKALTTQVVETTAGKKYSGTTETDVKAVLA